MTPTEKAIRDAIEGGWQPNFSFHKLTTPYKWLSTEEGSMLIMELDGTIQGVHVIEKILIDPKFWEALGKVRGWYQCPLRHVEHSNGCQQGYWLHMHRLIDALCDGLSIEDYLKSIE